MEPTDELIEQLRREKVDAARRMPPAEKLLAGAELFDYACEAARAGIRLRSPGASEAEVLAALRQRLELARRSEEGQ